MNIRAFSDIHNEFRSKDLWYPNALDTDIDTVLILAGDIAKAKSIPAYLNKLGERFRAVIHVAGNHEYYGTNLQSAAKYMQTGLADNVHHLHNSSVVIDGQKFVGTTLWTDTSRDEWFIAARMNDYACIRTDQNRSYRKLKPRDTTELHYEAKNFLKREVTKDTIVITHHNPLSPGYRERPSPLDYAYHACMEDFIESYEPKLWVSGHTHEVSDCLVFNTRHVVNCVGYPGEENKSVNQALL